MADSLQLHGHESVKNHKGKELTRINNPKGMSTFLLTEWWNKSKTYTDCTVFKVCVDDHQLRLAVPTTPLSFLRIDHDGKFNFSFFGFRHVKRAALFTDDFQLIEHYVFPAISGGKVMKVSPPGAKKKPEI